MKKSTLRITLSALLITIATGATNSAQAGVQNLPRFQETGSWSVGFEPELTLATSAGLAANAKFTYGLNEISNVQLVLGTGGGDRQFRAGGNVTFDFFPDIDQQPGIGVAMGALFYQADPTNVLEVHAFPYVHKAFGTSQGEVEPYLAVPVGIAFDGDGKYGVLTSATVGVLFKTMDNLRPSFEVSIPIANTETVVSAGVTYYH